MADTADLLIHREQTSLRFLVTTRFRDLILDGQLAPGQKLVERDLCEQFGVSRTLLREALRQLQAEGLLTNVLHKGLSVATISQQEAEDIYRVRQILEAEAGRGFALLATTGQIDDLQRTVDVLRLPAVIGDPHAQLQAKNRFYATLLSGGGNSVITQLLTQLNNRITLLRRLSMGSPGRLEQTTKELDAIVDACRRRASDEVADLCAAHVARAAGLALATYQRSNGDSSSPDPA